MTRTRGLNLLIPDGHDVEREAVAMAFEAHGGTVHRIGRFWDPPVFERSTVRIYGGTAFCLVLQQKLGLELCSPADGLILTVPSEFLKRAITRRTLGETASAEFPSFVKPLIPKQFRAALYDSRERLIQECRDLSLETALRVSEPVEFTAEVRAFLLNGTMLDAATYEGKSEIKGAAGLLEALARSISLPRTVVVDVGLIPGRGWAVIEFNATWGAGLNGCDAAKVLPAIICASEADLLFD